MKFYDIFFYNIIFSLMFCLILCIHVISEWRGEGEAEVVAVVHELTRTSRLEEMTYKLSWQNFWPQSQRDFGLWRWS